MKSKLLVVEVALFLLVAAALYFKINGGSFSDLQLKQDCSPVWTNQ